MVPKRSSLILGREVIEKLMSLRDWTLIDESRSIRPCASLLEESMPMLPSTFIEKGVLIRWVSIITHDACGL